jgi:HK97 gp10 family phage protein
VAYKPKANEQAVTVKGMPELVAALKAIGAPVEAIIKANEAVGMPVLRTAKNIAPVKSGALRDSIRLGKATTNVKIRAGLKKVPYANPIHWGWFYDRNNFITKNIKPNPFMARALGYNRDEILTKYVSEMKKLIDKYQPPESVKNRWFD